MEDVVISGDILEKMKVSPSDFLIDLAVYLYDKEQLTMGQAKKLAELTQIGFQKEMEKRDVYLKYDIKDLEKDLKNLSTL